MPFQKPLSSEKLNYLIEINLNSREKITEIIAEDQRHHVAIDAVHQHHPIHPIPIQTKNMFPIFPIPCVKQIDCDRSVHVDERNVPISSVVA